MLLHQIVTNDKYMIEKWDLLWDI